MLNEQLISLGEQSRTLHVAFEFDFKNRGDGAGFVIHAIQNHCAYTRVKIALLPSASFETLVLRGAGIKQETARGETGKNRRFPTAGATTSGASAP